MKFYMNLKKKKVELSIFAEGKEELPEIMNQMHRVFERDIIRNSPGKLYVGDTYMSCYCYSGEAKEYEDEFYASDYEIGIMQAKPFSVKKKNLYLKNTTKMKFRISLNIHMTMNLITWEHKKVRHL